MKIVAGKLIVSLAGLTTAGALWIASEWWEKGLATPLRAPIISPDGCYRIDRLKPFWILPNVFHRESDPNEDVQPTWFPWWENPGFYRLYDQRNGKLIGESNIYDLKYASGPIIWGEGSGAIYAGMIFIGTTLPGCRGIK